MRVLVVGAHGRVGARLVSRLRQAGYGVRAIVPDARRALSAADEVLSAAAAQAMPVERLFDGITALAILDDGFSVLRDGRNATFADAEPGLAQIRRLAEGARAARLAVALYLSDIQAVAEPGQGVVTDASLPKPHKLYGRAKWEAEQRLFSTLAGSTTRGVALRPPVVYGPGALDGLMRAVYGANQRLGQAIAPAAASVRLSVLALDNLADACFQVLRQRGGPGGGFCLHDGPAWTRARLITALVRARTEVPRSADPVPAIPSDRLSRWASPLRSAAHRAASPIASRTLRGYVVDDHRFRLEFGWQPVVTTEDVLAAALMMDPALDHPCA